MGISGKKIGETKWAKKRLADLVVANKRRTHRHTMTLNTDVHFHEQFVNGMFRCRTGNISLNGVFLPAENIPITRKTDIELVFHAHNQSKHYSLAAKVIRISDEGAALVFCPENERQIRDFRRFLFKAKVASRQ